MDDRGIYTPTEKNSKLKAYHTPRLVSFGQVELLTKTGGNTTTEEDAHKKVGG